METYNKAKIIKKLQNSPYILITPRILKDYVGIVSERTLYRLIFDLANSEILGKLERGKYFLSNTKVDDFVKANIVYPP